MPTRRIAQPAIARRSSATVAAGPRGSCQTSGAHGDEVRPGARQRRAVGNARGAFGEARQDEQLAPPGDQLVDLRRRRAPGIAERDIVGAGVAGNHRGVARAAAGDPEDALGAERGAGRGHGPGRAEVDPVGAGLEREIDVVLEQERDAAGAADRPQAPRPRRASRRAPGPPGATGSRRCRRPRAPPPAAARSSPDRARAG